MTLKQKFKNSPDKDGWIDQNESRAKNNVKIAEDFAICFHDWAKNVKTSETTKQLLELFKKQNRL